jgi:hypothetical protein
MGGRGVADGDDVPVDGSCFVGVATVTSTRPAWPNPSVHVVSAPPGDRRVSGHRQR